MHSIRLREPWKSKWEEGQDRPIAVYTRTFHRPTGLRSGQQVLLDIKPVNSLRNEPVAELLAIRLNDLELNVDGRHQAKNQVCSPVTEHLESFNRLQLSLVVSENWDPRVLSPGQMPPALIDVLEITLVIDD